MSQDTYKINQSALQHHPTNATTSDKRQGHGAKNNMAHLLVSHPALHTHACCELTLASSMSGFTHTQSVIELAALCDAMVVVNSGHSVRGTPWPGQ
jgi:hypothetical protein